MKGKRRLKSPNEMTETTTNGIDADINGLANNRSNGTAVKGRKKTDKTQKQLTDMYKPLKIKQEPLSITDNCTKSCINSENNCFSSNVDENEAFSDNVKDDFIKKPEIPNAHSTQEEIDAAKHSMPTINKLNISPKKPEVKDEPKKCTIKTSVRRKLETTSQIQITDFYKVRRSNRKTHTEVMKEKRNLVEECILKGIEDGLEVINIVGKGRGVVTTKEFKRGDFIVEYSGELIDNEVAKKREIEYSKNQNTGCYMYYFLHNSRLYCVDATEETGRYGRLINHSKTGNLSTKSFVINGVPHLIFVANRDILPAEELLYDYGDRRKESLEAHPWLAT